MILLLGNADSSKTMFLHDSVMALVYNFTFLHRRPNPSPDSNPCSHPNVAVWDFTSFWQFGIIFCSVLDNHVSVTHVMSI